MQSYTPDLNNINWPIDPEDIPSVKPDFYVGEEDDINKMMDADAEDKAEQGYTVHQRVKIGRNELCPCGSGKKFKKCHLNSAKVAK